ncbi:molybdopterin molybdotransferase MoeA [Nesterenkonia sp. YGD6]|uniref:molybdopterin molybdotransferase MoeA n=1 Tax=Nesterenkonia sp. YGD6 TaxID=2901231 RepID=UPI001F4C92CE|nr:molybdopterin molybdotransferase MoeA [Nesterenkonia sp. YGD6]MCH8562940.1 molybdopterin molybdotransferase MoeA [Nesterenkonia sp. YGD6]
MMTLMQARERAAALDALAPARMSLEEAIGSVLLDPVLALQDIPHVSTSAMDGWALAAESLPFPDGDSGWALRPESAHSPATRPTPLRPGEATEVLTGSPVPAGTHAVLRSEHGVIDGDRLRALRTSPDTAAQRNVRQAGAECRAEDELVPAGVVLTPARAAVAAVAGHDYLTVIRRPRVQLVLTGAEVTTSGTPAPGQVRDVFGLALPQMLKELGAASVASQRLGDDPETLARTLRQISAAGTTDLIISSGGTAHSRADALRPALDMLGAQLEVDSVDMRPGHPVLLAQLPREEGPLYLLGLPGNPLAGFSALTALGVPLLRALRGIPAEARTPTLRRTAGAQLPGARRGVRLLPVRRGPQGVLPAGHSRAHMMRGLADSDALAIVPEGGLAQGDPVVCLTVPGQREEGLEWDG